MQLPHEEHTYGKPLRVQTPVRNVLANDFGEMSAVEMQTKYVSKVKKSSKCPTQIPLTNAQAHADNAIRQKLMGSTSEPKQLFKLQRF